MRVSFSSLAPASVAADLLAVFVPSGKLGAALAPVDGDPNFAGTLASACADEGFDGRANSTFFVPALGRLAAKRLLLVGCGAATASDLRAAAGVAGFQARNKGAGTVALAWPCSTLGPRETSLCLEALAEGNYRFDKYKPAGQRKTPAGSVVLVGVEENVGAVATALALAAGQALARDLVNEPAAEVYPETMAKVAEGLAGEGIAVTVWDETKIREAGMGGITAVGQGSARPPRFVHISYTPAGPASRHVALVGKGVTFDSGGLSIKPNDGMLTMRCDMGGAAAVLGTMKAVSMLKPSVKVDAIFGAVENMPSGTSYKLGDILKMHNGKRVEIHNTDAEGRLVLADCLSYASGLGPDTVIDLATLTGAAVVALGEWYTALYSREEELAAEIQGAASTSGEAVWRMPLPDLYRDKIKAEWGETKNTGGRNAGSITAALFLSDFVTTKRWAHLDIAGPAFLDSTLMHYCAGGTGTMVRTLCRFLGA